MLIRLEVRSRLLSLSCCARAAAVGWMWICFDVLGYWITHREVRGPFALRTAEGIGCILRTFGCCWTELEYVLSGLCTYPALSIQACTHNALFGLLDVRSRFHCLVAYLRVDWMNVLLVFARRLNTVYLDAVWFLALGGGGGGSGSLSLSCVVCSVWRNLALMWLLFWTQQDIFCSRFNQLLIIRFIVRNYWKRAVYTHFVTIMIDNITTGTVLAHDVQWPKAGLILLIATCAHVRQLAASLLLLAR